MAPQRKVLIMKTFSTSQMLTTNFIPMFCLETGYSQQKLKIGSSLVKNKEMML